MSDDAIAPRVLIVDDDDLVGRMARAMVTAAGAEARLETTVDSFLAAHDLWNPTHVMIDLVLGAEDGLMVLEELARRRSSAAVIVSSGQDARVLESALRFATAHGLTVAGSLAKPYSRMRLAEILQAPTGAPVVGQGPAGHAQSPALLTDDPLMTPEGLHRLLEEDRITVALQPKVSCTTGEVVGYEALARCQTVDGRNIPPGVFVPVAEANGLASELTNSVMRSALTWFTSARLPASQTISINISASEVGESSLDQRLVSLTRECGVDPSRIIVELTETAAMSDPVTSLKRLTRLRLEGFQVSLDDFGTGYSSMLELARLPFSELKVDRSFVATATTSEESRTVVRSIIDLGHALGMSCTAEGVERPADLDLLVEMGCDNMQGFYLGRPMWPEDIARWAPPERALPPRLR
ncbi:EAL domain-containing response regulator [Demequina zhanjiangensis]|uniref:EAL domain-containing response regulator n=1 Tax=Demequina zhanjiangensis TaxID=3051659 RepID=A0ABT8G1I3_9MICO|nr:EAL domain-containing response regulator [Demequina sp. SYSU T00b26]MDN4472996.1 EAL domain-containing response regulator [Demequina sp. SYSU T00b26]